MAGVDATENELSQLKFQFTSLNIDSSTVWALQLGREMDASGSILQSNPENGSLTMLIFNGRNDSLFALLPGKSIGRP